MSEKNLDVEINSLSWKIAKEAKEKGKENHVDKTLGVLVNDGVYAYYIYCKAQKEKNGSNPVEDILVKEVLKSDVIKMIGLPEVNCDSEEKLEEFFSETISNEKNKNKLFFFRDVVERVLIYARYHLKALEAGNK